MTVSASGFRRALGVAVLGVVSAWAACYAEVAMAAPAACPGDDSGLTLPPGFCASIFADDIGHARHLVVSAEGVVYVNT